MAKILFIGDTHLSAINPISRKETREQYRELLLNKLESIRQICLQDNINNVIILGDVFNNNSGIMNSFEVDIWTKFLEFKANGIELYTIIGNHDMLFQNDSEFKGTYLNKAFITGIIKHLDEITIDNVYIKGIDFGKDLFSLFDYITGTYTLGAMILVYCIFMGWKICPRLLQNLHNNGAVFKVYFRFVLKWLAPIVLIILFLSV